MCGVDRSVVLDLASGFKTPETVREDIEEPTCLSLRPAGWIIVFPDVS